MTHNLSVYSTKWVVIPTLLLLMAKYQPAPAASLYKWIDENGEIRYSDQLPADQSRKRHQKLTSDGRIVETTEAAKSAEQLALEKEEKKRQEEEEKRLKQEKAIKDHHDNVLLMTFSNETEILEAQNERLDVIDSVIKLLRKNIANEQEKLTQQEKRANQLYTQKGQDVPGGMAQNIEYSVEKILGIQRQLGLKLEERGKIKQQYVNDLLRYRELTKTGD